MNICNGCRRPIKWIRTSAGFLTPVDPEPVCIMTGLGQSLFYSDDGRVLQGCAVSSAESDDVGFVPHWATCPNAADFKRKRKP